MEPVGAFGRGAELENIGAGSVQGEDFETVGPGGAQRSESDGSAQKIESRRRAAQSAAQLFITSPPFISLTGL